MPDTAFEGAPAPEQRDDMPRLGNADPAPRPVRPARPEGRNDDTEKMPSPLHRGRGRRGAYRKRPNEGHDKESCSDCSESTDETEQNVPNAHAEEDISPVPFSGSDSDACPSSDCSDSTAAPDTPRPRPMPRLRRRGKIQSDN